MPLVDLHAALQIAHGWQILHSPDPAIRRVAREQIYQIADIRYRLDRAHWQSRREELCELFLNGELGASTHAPPKRRNGDIGSLWLIMAHYGSLWVDVRKNHKTFGLTISIAPDKLASGTPAWPLQLRLPHYTECLEQRNVLRHVKQHLKNLLWRACCAHMNQGKTARAHGGGGSGFTTLPRGMWKNNYRFAVAARFNILDTSNALSRRWLHAHDLCRTRAAGGRSHLLTC